MANEFDYLSIIADKDVVDPTYDISNIRTTTPTSERLLAAVPEYSGLKYDPTQRSYLEDLYNLYSGGLPTIPVAPAPVTPTTVVDTSVDTGGTGITAASAAQNMGGVNTPFEQNLLDQGAGVQAEPGAPISAPGEGMLTQQAIDDLADYPVTPANLNDPTTMIPQIPEVIADDPTTMIPQLGSETPSYIGGDIPLQDTGAGIDDMYGTDYQGEEYIEPQSMLASDMIEAQKASMPKGRAALGTIDRTIDPDFYSDQETEVGNYPQELTGTLSVDAPYGVNPNTGVPYETPRTIADQNRILGQTFEADEVDEQGNLLEKGLEKLKSIIPDFDPVSAAIKLGVNTIVGKPISLLTDLLQAGLEAGPTFQTQKAIELGLAAPGETQDKYGINTQSMMGDYDQYNVDRVEELEDIVADQISRGLTNTIQMRELEDRKEYVDRSGAGGDIDDDPTGDAEIAEIIARDDRIDAGIEAADEEPAPSGDGPQEVDAGTADVQDYADIYEPPTPAPAPSPPPSGPHYDRPSGDNQNTGGKSGGYTGGGWCFDPNTFVQMADGSEKKIKEIQLGDNTKGGEVTGVFQFKASDEIHDYKGVTVAGSHYVKEDGKFIMVQDSPLSVKIDKIPVVYSLDTTGRRIFIKGIEFADYNGDGIAKGFLHNAGLELNGFNKEVLRQVENRLI